MNEPLYVQRQGGTLELTLNRPARRNALSQELIAALTQALRAAAGDDAVHSVVLTGAAPAFCAGLDLRELAEARAESDQHDTSALLALYELIDAFPKAVIAAVNGAAVAGGAGLVCVCDAAVCGEAAQIGFPGIRHGLVAPVVMPYLLRAVGERSARYLLLTGEMLPARRAAEIGLVNEMVPDADLLGCARQLAGLLGSHPAGAVSQTKAALRGLRSLRGAEPAEEVRGMSAGVPLTNEARAGVQRFLES